MYPLLALKSIVYASLFTRQFLSTVKSRVRNEVHITMKPRIQDQMPHYAKSSLWTAQNASRCLDARDGGSSSTSGLRSYGACPFEVTRDIEAPASFKSLSTSGVGRSQYEIVDVESVGLRTSLLDRASLRCWHALLHVIHNLAYERMCPNCVHQ